MKTADDPADIERARGELRDRFDRIKQIVNSPEYNEKTQARLKERAAADWYYEKKAKAERLRAQGIHEEHWPHLAAPERTQAITEVDRFMELPEGAPKSSILVLGGPGGVGKSFAGANAVSTHGGRCVNSGQLVMPRSWEELADFWDELQSARLLVIDDLGTEKKNEEGTFDAKFFELIDGRLKKKTIITTNLSGPAFVERYAGKGTALERLSRRFQGFGAFVPLTERAT